MNEKRWTLNRCLPLLLLAFFLQSCQSVQEKSNDFFVNEADKKFDIIIGDDYDPPIAESVEVDEILEPPVLFLPIEQNISASYAKGFLSKFRETFNAIPLIHLPEWGTRKSSPTQKEVEALAQKADCLAVLFLELSQPSAYPPFHIQARITLQTTDTNEVIWHGTADYDARNKTVANAARRFAQKQLKRTDDPGKSKVILRNNRLFIQFTAYNLAKKLNSLAQVPVLPQKIEKTSAH